MHPTPLPPRTSTASWHSIRTIVISILLAGSILSTPLSVGHSQIINEIRLDQTGADTDEYFELKGSPGAGLSGLYYIVIGDNVSVPACGVVESVTNLSGRNIQSDGFFALRNIQTVPTLTGFDAADSLIFENNDNVTHLLVQNFSGFLGQDLDSNNDGNLDTTPWSAVLDCVGVIEDAVPGCGSPQSDDEIVYCSTRVGPDGAFAPGHVYRCADTNVWQVGPFNPAGGLDTPGSPNPNCLNPPPDVVSTQRTPCAPSLGQVATVFATILNATSASLTYSVNGGPGVTVPMSSIGGDNWQGTIPAQGVNGTRITHFSTGMNASGSDQSPTDGYFAGVTSIGPIRLNDASGFNIYRSYGIRVRGNVTVAQGTFSTINLDFWLQDATGGIKVFQSGFLPASPALGNLVEVSGVLEQFNGILEVTGSTCGNVGVSILGPGSPVAPLQINTCDLDETKEGLLVQVMDAGLDTTGAGSANWLPNRSYGTTNNCPPSVRQVFIDTDTDIDGTPIPSLQLRVVGLVTQFDTTVPWGSGYEVAPRGIVDIAPRFMSRAQATQLVINQVIQPSPYAAQLVGFLYNRVAPDSLLDPGDVVSDPDTTFINVISAPTYLFWLDDTPNPMWQHPTTFVLVDAASGGLTIQTSLSWPFVNGAEIDRFYVEGNASSERFYGLYPTGTDVPFAYTMTSPGDEGAWGLIFLGRTRKAEEKALHMKDIARWQQILNGAPKGPKVRAANIKTLTGPNLCGASEKMVCDSLDAITGCTKLYITYVGHGNKEGSMELRKDNGESESLFYTELADKLVAKGIKEVCFVPDCCYSGQAIEVFEKKGIKGTVITAAGPCKPGHATPGVGWDLTVALQKCANDCAADLVKDSKITYFEALAWALTLNSQLVTDGATGDILGDGKTSAFARPECKVLNQVSDGESNKMCFIVKTHGFKIGDDTTLRRSLYVKNLDDKGPHGGQGLCRVVLTYRNGANQAKADTLGRIMLDKKGDPKGRDRKCLIDVDPKATDFKMKKIASSPRGRLGPLSVPLERETQSLARRTTDYDPDEFVFQEIPVTGSPGDEFIACPNGPPGWNLTMDPPAFIWSAGLDTALVLVRGVVPDTATRGGEILATIVNETTLDTMDLTIDALLTGTLATPIGGGQSYYSRALASSAGMNVSAGLATLVKSRLDLKTPAACLVGPAGSLFIQESVVKPDSGVAYTFTAQGHLEWNATDLIDPMGGLRLQGASGIVTLSSVFGSKHDGLVATGNQAGMNLQFFVIENSAHDGLVFDGATNAVFRGLRIIGSGSDDVVLKNGSVVTLIDADYDDSAENVGAGSTLTRGWTTPFLFQAPNGQSLPEAIVHIRNALGTLVATDTTDEHGLTDFHELVQYQQQGNLRTDHTPHEISAHWATFDTTFVYTADFHRAVEVTWGSASSGTDELPVRFLVTQNTPNPFQRTTTIHYELPEPTRVTLDMFDIEGRRVATLVDGNIPAGQHHVVWDPAELPAGIYWYRLAAGNSVTTKKLVRLRGR